jgi:hypothetical protein
MANYTQAVGSERSLNNGVLSGKSLSLTEAAELMDLDIASGHCFSCHIDNVATREHVCLGVRACVRDMRGNVKIGDRHVHMKVFLAVHVVT